MSQLRIGIRENRQQFFPGDLIEGAVGWKLDRPAHAIEVRLFWHTEGKGTQDVGIVDKLRFEHPQTEEARPFQFRLPPEPYTFSGKLISLIWALELVVEPSHESIHVEFVMSPAGQELHLHKEG